MKNHQKLFIAAIMAVSLSLNVAAATGLVQIDVDPSVKILVNGAEFHPQDANGKDAMTFIYDGTTYAPLRALAEAYGLQVGYDSKKNMATVDLPANSTEKEEETSPRKSEETTTKKPAETTTKRDTATLGEKNALRAAQSYLDLMPFSRSGLIKQLKYEKYSDSEAEYAVNHCGANWKEQAVRSARSYIELMSFSREGLIKQLEYEGYTNGQAVYAADQIGY